MGQRFDFATFDEADPTPLRGAVDESGVATTLQTIANSRGTVGMFGSGYIELLARQMTAELQSERDRLAPGTSGVLVANGVSFGELRRDPDGGYDVSRVEGLPAASLTGEPPNLLVRPFHQAGAVVSLRQFTNNAMNHHHGIQSTERFGTGDPDGDGVVEEMSEADITALAVFQATLQAPVRVIPRDQRLRTAIRAGETNFVEIGCSHCHRPYLPLQESVYTEPSPYNPPGNLRLQDVDHPLAVDLNDPHLPGARLRAAHDGSTLVPAFTDLKLHSIYETGDANCEPLNQSNGELASGNCAFLTRKLWGAYSEPGFGHHGQFTTLREAIDAHAGEAFAAMEAWWALPETARAEIIEFLKTLRVAPGEVKALFVDENLRSTQWREFPYDAD